MSQTGERPQPRRRSRPGIGVGNTDDPTPLVYSQPVMGGRPASTPRPDVYPEDDDPWDPPRQNTSVIRLDNQQNAQTRRSAGMSQTTTGGSGISRRQQTSQDFKVRQPRYPIRSDTPPSSKTNKTMHWLLPLGVGMIAMIVLWVLGSSALAWGVQFYNGIRYGYPRTFQTDAVVGHSDSPAHPSHFIAINLNRQVVVVELMGGDPSKTVTYVAPVYIAGENGDLAPVTLEFRDVNGDGKPDMIIHIHLPNQDQVSVFINDGSKFRPANGNDKIRLN
jgi:hypothetical protein